MTPPVFAHELPTIEGSSYPAPFQPCTKGRSKAKLGDHFGLTNFGVNRTTLAPGAATALLHKHSHQDEFVLVLSGAPTLVTETGETTMEPGMVVGFPAGGPAHQIVNRSDAEVVLLEIGDRSPEDTVCYPNDDLQAQMRAPGQWAFSHKDGTPYDPRPGGVDHQKEQP